MLGVRRATVTDTLHVLEGRWRSGIRAVRSWCGDRAVLEELAGHSYGYAEAHYRSLIGPFGRASGKAGRPSRLNICSC
jgi:hypothetical protein